MEIALGARSTANIELKIKNIPATAHQSALYMGVKDKRFIEVTWQDNTRIIRRMITQI